MYKCFKLHFFAILSIVTLTSVLTTEVEKCNNVPTPIVEIKGCQTPPCHLKQGEFAEMIVNFKSTSYVNALDMKVAVQLGGFPIPYPLEKELSDVCLNLLNTHCPLEENEPGAYLLKMPILKDYPPISLKLRFTIQSEDRKKMSCFAVQCKVVSAN